ncbi:hypothetical protein Q8A67_012201 [Cirrhinus molitorella]|uniref:Somatolactin alpha n=1 Tax=Cirrhinus molitorella TaxID=172907 RepID=A0AA88PPL2_9TELE|nr:hypothetical protein Q8A67_012201 [Cirrhinus molitorella]
MTFSVTYSGLEACRLEMQFYCSRLWPQHSLNSFTSMSVNGKIQKVKGLHMQESKEKARVLLTFKQVSSCIYGYPFLQAWLCCLSLWPCWLSHGVPLDCKDEVGSLSHCASISQEKLLDRVIQHAELIYRVSEESCTLFEEMFVPYPLHALRNQGGNMCHTKPFPIPGSKSEIQQISDKWLLHSVLMLVQSWMEPLIYLQTTLNRYDDAPDALLNKTKWVSDKLLSLEQGVVVLIRKMLDEGILTSPSIFEHTLNPYNEQSPEVLESVLRDYNLLICFKKDAHKMETFLKLLKCRQSNKLSCLSY